MGRGNGTVRSSKVLIVSFFHLISSFPKPFEVMPSWFHLEGKTRYRTGKRGKKITSKEGENNHKGISMTFDLTCREPQ